MNKSRKQIDRFILVLTLASLCFVTVQPVSASEPAYKGQPLSEWLLVLKLQQLSGNHKDEIPDGMEQPEDAIRQMGTNAIPALLDILGATEGNKSRVLGKFKSRKFRAQFLRRDTDLNDLRGVAVDAFGLLGTNAVSAIPQINKLFRDGETCSEAGQTLGELGPEGIATLTNGLSDENTDIRGMTIWIIGEKAPVDSNTVARLMIGYLNDAHDATKWQLYLGGYASAQQVKVMNLQNRADAAKYLGGKDPALAIPALLPLLDENTNYSVIMGASRALSSYGALAEAAIPKLLSIYTNHISDKGWNVELMWAIKGIDLDAAAKAETLLVNSGPLNSARTGYTTTLLPSGKELIVGGYIHTEFPKVADRNLSSAELLDPVTGKWTETGEMNIARWDHTAILLHNGEVLVVGGSTSKEFDSTSAEIYGQTTGKWTETDSLNGTHRARQAVLLPNGKVRIPGGWDGHKITDDELYDPDTGSWTVIPNK
jgi:hypothetical protein